MELAFFENVASMALGVLQILLFHNRIKREGAERERKVGIVIEKWQGNSLRETKKLFQGHGHMASALQV